MSQNDFQALDSETLTPFHRKVTLLSAAGMFLDGYDITVIAVALPVLTKQWHIQSQLMSGAVDRVGRRPLLISGFSGLVLALLALALQPKPGLGLLVALLSVAVLFANSGPGILNLIYPSEVYPTSVRATGAGLAAAFSRVGAVISTLFFPQMVASWGIGKALWVFVAAGVIGLAITVALAPETRNRSLEELSGPLVAEPVREKVAV